MKENLYYLFISGLLLGSGPCLVFCAPILVSYTAAHTKTIKKSIFYYLIFSFSRITSYIILGIFCAALAGIINSPLFKRYLELIHLVLGCFIVLIGTVTIFSKEKKAKKICELIHGKAARNIGIVGSLVGFSPCLPLFGILNYITLISHTIYEAIIFSFVFGLGTIISPLFIFVLISAQLSALLTRKNIFEVTIRIICGAILVFLGGKVILQSLALAF
jgi:sulfite exporter TauE/SafE